GVGGGRGLVAELGRRGVLRRARDRALGPPDRDLRAAGGEGAVRTLARHWRVPALGALLAVAVVFPLADTSAVDTTFAINTLIFQLMAFNLAFTQGNQGVSAPLLTWDPATYNNPFYYAALVIAVAAIALSWQIRRSRFGLRLLAIRDDEDRARGLGVRAMRAK